MKTTSVSFKSVDDFRALKLKDKNSYLQELADDFAATNDREAITLDKDALSRLRRYYSRRVWADLKLENAPDTPINRALRSLGEGVRKKTAEADVAAALMQETRPQRILRAAPDDDAQLNFFVPTLFDAPIKDDVNLMDVAVFSISRQVQKGVLQYELKDCLITIEGGAQVGLATVFDYDIFLHMVSFLAEEVKRYKQDVKKGLRPTLPPKIYRTNAAHIFKFTRRTPNTRAYDSLENSLDRLKATNIKIVNLAGGKRREVDNRSLIGDYRIVTRTDSNRPSDVEITIPDWVYTSIVSDNQKLPLLTLHEDYFLISSGIGRYITRLGRKAAGTKQARYSFTEIHKRCSPAQEFRKFSYELKKFVQRTKAFPLPGLELEITQGKQDFILVMTKQEGEAITNDDDNVQFLSQSSPYADDKN